MSIQLTLGGHSFSAEDWRNAVEKLAEAGKGGSIEVEVLTGKTLLIPREEFSGESAGAYLRIAGLGCAPHEVPVWSDPEQPAVAVMAADAAAVETLREKRGGRIRFVSPLLTEPACPPPAVWFHARQGLLYMKVYDGEGLQMAEVVSCAAKEDFRFLLDRLDTALSLAGFTACVTGEGSRELGALAKRYFGKTVCV